MPARRRAAASPRSSAPGLASRVTSASAASPKRRRTRSTSRASAVGGDERRRAAADVERCRAAAAQRRRRPEFAGRARRREARSRSRGAARSAADPVPRSARGGTGVDDEVAVRADRDAERDVDVERDGRPRRRRPGAGVAGRGNAGDLRRHHRSRGADSRGPMTRQPSGGRRRLSISSSSRPRGRNWPAWPVHRKTAKRVTAWPRNAAAMPPVTAGDPAAGEPDEERHHQHVAVPPRRPEPRRERVEERLDRVRRARVDVGHEEDAEDRPAERDLVDERGRRPR